MSKLRQISETFTAAGKADTHVAVIHCGLPPGEKIVHSRVERVEAQQLGAPAIIVVGEVENSHPALRYTHTTGSSRNWWLLKYKLRKLEWITSRTNT